MPTVLASLCNIKRTGAAFALLAGDVARRRFALVDCSAWAGDADTGITGLLATERAIYACIQAGETSRIAVLGHDLKQTAVIADERFRDLHSIKKIGDRICVVSTGNSKVFWFDEGEKAVRVLWEYEHADERLHINDIGERDGRLFLMSHVHPRFDGTGRPGAIWDMESREVLLGSLKHPHTLHPAGDLLHYLSSDKGQLLTHDWRTGETVTRRLGGYMRGLAATQDGFLVACSSLRFYSRKQGPGVNAVDLGTVVGDPRFMSFLYEVRGGRIRRRHNLTHLGLEIYDLLLVDLDYDAIAAPNAAQLRSQALYRRIAELEQLSDLQDVAAGGQAAGDGGDAGIG